MTGPILCGLRKRAQRGVAAVEFALIFPLFMSICALAYWGGTSIYITYELKKYASAAVRTCVARVPAVQASVSMRTCATNTAMQILRDSGFRACQPVPFAYEVRSTAGIVPNMYEVSLKLTCTLDNTLLGTFIPLSVRVPLNGSSRFPYVRPQPVR